MTLPQDLTPAVRDWLREPDKLPPPRIAEIGRLVHQTPQEHDLVSRLDLGRFRMFTALKFVAAGVIVALFGGFLLAGGLTPRQVDEVLPAAVSASPTVEAESEATTAPTEPTDPSQPVVRSDVLPGVELTVEEIEPGVLRVWSDGRRDLPDIGLGAVVAGHDGSIWLPPANADYDFVRLGLPAKRSPKWPRHSQVEGVVVDREGTVWMHESRTDGRDEIVARFRSHEQGTWTVHLRAPALTDEVLTVAPDGRVWVVYRTGGTEPGLAVARLGADRLEPLGASLPLGNARDIFVTESGEVWIDQVPGRSFMLGEDGAWDEWSAGSLVRYREDDAGWQEVPLDVAVVDPWASPVEVGSDGTVWFAGVEPLMADGQPVPGEWFGPTPGDPFLMRFDGSGWQRWGPADGVPSFGGGLGITLRQAPDGGVWMASQVDVEALCSGQEGVARFDGSTWQHFLSGHCVSGLGVTPDGSVWLRAASGDGRKPEYGLYVVTPEALSAS